MENETDKITIDMDELKGYKADESVKEFITTGQSGIEGLKKGTYTGEIQRSVMVYQHTTPLLQYVRIFSGLTQENYKTIPEGSEILKDYKQGENESLEDFKNRKEKILKEIPFHKDKGNIEKWIPDLNVWAILDEASVENYIIDTKESKFNHTLADFLIERIYRELKSPYTFADGKEKKLYQGAGYNNIKIPMSDIFEGVKNLDMSEVERKNLYPKIHNGIKYLSQISFRWSDSPEVVRRYGSYGKVGAFIINYKWNDSREHPPNTFIFGVNSFWFIGTDVYPVYPLDGGGGYFIRSKIPRLKNGDMPPASKVQLISLLDSLPNAKGLFIKKGVKVIRKPIRFFFHLLGVSQKTDNYKVRGIAGLFADEKRIIYTNPRIIRGDSGAIRFNKILKADSIIEIHYQGNK